ncbi:MAG TPA: Pr6Pr family membrane protein [Bauldia sp.]|nr:Pr6Pr family membrane protein [Bauldia sp.]
MERLYALIFMLLGWFTVIGQYVVGHAHTVAGTIDYFSYFTILSNILVAATFTAAAVAPDARAGRLLLRPTVAMATAVYITVTGLTFYFLLSSLYALEGWTKHFDHLLHYVMPPAFVLFWLLFVPKGTLHLRNVPWMMVPPLLYGAWTLVHGAIADWYPYPFVDVSKLGYPRVLLHIVEFVFIFAFAGVIYVFLDRVIHHLGIQSHGDPRTARPGASGP